jgi:hypothetical protein
LSTASSLADQQNKSSDTYQHRNQNTDDERSNRMPTGLDLFRPGAFLRCSDAQPEEKVAHRLAPKPIQVAEGYGLPMASEQKQITSI